MQKDELNDILHQHASGFEVKPVSASFEKVMQKRTAARNRQRTIVWSTAASLIAISGVLLLQLPHWQSPEATVDKGLKTPGSNNIIYPKPEVLIPENDQPKTLANADPGLKGSSSSRSTGKKNTHRSTNDQIIAHPNASFNKRLFAAIDAPVTTDQHPVSLTEDAVGSSVNNVYLPAQNNIERISSPALFALEKKTAAMETTLPAAKGIPDVPIKADTAGLPVIVTAVKDTTPLTLVSVPDSVIPLPVAQENKTPDYKWRATALFTPQLVNSVYNANSDATLSWMQQYLKNREQNDKALYSFNTGLKIERKINKWFSVSLGLLYSTVKFEEIRMVSTTVRDTTKGMGLAVNPPNKTSQNVTRNSFDILFNSLEVPVQLYYTLVHKKMYYQATAGMSYSYLFATRSLVFDVTDSLNVQETNDARNKRLQQNNFLLLAGINVGYQINKRWSCYIGPVVRYSLNSIYSKDYIIRQRPYYVGAETGISVSF